MKPILLMFLLLQILCACSSDSQPPTEPDNSMAEASAEINEIYRAFDDIHIAKKNYSYKFSGDDRLFSPCGEFQEEFNKIKEQAQKTHTKIETSPQRNKAVPSGTRNLVNEMKEINTFIEKLDGLLNPFCDIDQPIINSCSGDREVVGVTIYHYMSDKPFLNPYYRLAPLPTNIPTSGIIEHASRAGFGLSNSTRFVSVDDFEIDTFYFTLSHDQVVSTRFSTEQNEYMRNNTNVELQAFTECIEAEGGLKTETGQLFQAIVKKASTNYWY